MKTQEDIKEFGAKLRNVYYKDYQRTLELYCSTLYLEFIDNLIIEPDNKPENILTPHRV